MALPFFYISPYDPGSTEITLDEDNSRHIVQVLRMRPGAALRLTDGKGTLLTAVILEDHKKKCRVQVQTADTQPSGERPVFLAISLLKNASRFEWFLEKATEIGVREIIPLLCEHTERQQVRQDRLQNILVSAMLQSQQSWLPILHPPTPIGQLITGAQHDQRFIAHCLEAPRPTASLPDALRQATSGPVTSQATFGTNRSPASAPVSSRLILIGPEGDFSSKEVELALEHQFIPVTLGHNRLRAETAGVVAATLLCIG
jgi:16S rRNA (uracil1498-N3)-methyltransferase